MKKIAILLLLSFILVITGVFVVVMVYLPGLLPVIKGPPADIADLIDRQAGEGEVAAPENSTGLPLELPDGFSISIFARGQGKVRDIIAGPTGGLLASQMDRGRVVALPDLDQDGAADMSYPVLEGLDNPHGLVFLCGSEESCLLYVAETGGVSMYDFDTKRLKAENKRKIVDLPAGGGHYTRSLHLVTIDGQNQLLISVGSSCNACPEDDWRRAKILLADLRGNNLREYAGGLRNSVFMATNPITGEIWATEMGRDWLGDDRPPDEVNIIRQGEDYGWPICYGRNIHDTDYDKGRYVRDPCADKAPSTVDLQAHSAPLGIAFFGEEGWPEKYWYDALVAYHGSWNRSTPTGYKVVRLVVDDQGQYQRTEDFISGWLTGGNEALGRPVDILIQPGGLIYISDDKAGLIYRLAYQGGNDMAPDRSDPAIRLDSPAPGQWAKSPLAVSGAAPGPWYFEGDFPLEVQDESGRTLGQSYARAQGEWMTEDQVEFTGKVEYDLPTTGSGFLVLKKDNPSGLPENAEEYKARINFAQTTHLTGEPCSLDADCAVPGEYAAMSICPFESKCLEQKCTTVCPDSFIND